MNFKFFYTVLIFSLISIFKDNRLILLFVSLVEKTKEEIVYSRDKNRYNDISLIEKIYFKENYYTTRKKSKYASQKEQENEINSDLQINLPLKPAENYNDGNYTNTKVNKKLTKSIFMNIKHRKSKFSNAVELRNLFECDFRTKIWDIVRNTNHNVLRI